jgi:hypothetical protein
MPVGYQVIKHAGGHRIWFQLQLILKKSMQMMDNYRKYGNKPQPINFRNKFAGTGNSLKGEAHR